MLTRLSVEPKALLSLETTSYCRVSGIAVPVAPTLGALPWLYRSSEQT